MRPIHATVLLPRSSAVGSRVLNVAAMVFESIDDAVASFEFGGQSALLGVGADLLDVGALIAHEGSYSTRRPSQLCQTKLAGPWARPA
jgi:hypothetical protein